MAAKLTVAESCSFRWVRAASGRAHLDLGERESNSLRVHGKHIIVTACRAHLNDTAEVLLDSYSPKCSNCQQHARLLAKPKLVPSL